jgi:hypothetical protein
MHRALGAPQWLRRERVADAAATDARSYRRRVSQRTGNVAAVPVIVPPVLEMDRHQRIGSTSAGFDSGAAHGPWRRIHTAA